MESALIPVIVVALTAQLAYGAISRPNSLYCILPFLGGVKRLPFRRYAALPCCRLRPFMVKPVLTVFQVRHMPISQAPLPLFFPILSSVTPSLKSRLLPRLEVLTVVRTSRASLHSIVSYPFPYSLGVSSNLSSYGVGALPLDVVLIMKPVSVIA